MHEVVGILWHLHTSCCEKLKPAEVSIFHLKWVFPTQTGIVLCMD